MLMNNIFAHTPEGPYPEFISVNEADDGQIGVTVRNPADTNNWGVSRPGETVTIMLTPELALTLAKNILEHFNVVS